MRLGKKGASSTVPLFVLALRCSLILAMHPMASMAGSSIVFFWLYTSMEHMSVAMAKMRVSWSLLLPPVKPSQSKTTTKVRRPFTVCTMGVPADTYDGVREVWGVLGERSDMQSQCSRRTHTYPTLRYPLSPLHLCHPWQMHEACSQGG